MSPWPLQSQADSYYGNPRGRNGNASLIWKALNLTAIAPPFRLTYAGAPVSRITIHRKCAASLLEVLHDINDAANHDQRTLDLWGVSIFGGSFNYRLKRASSTLSMHAYGCAIDLAPERFPMGQTQNRFVSQVIDAFAGQGWINLTRDRMHFQAARL